MLSRTASELYWMARYLERAENIARVLDVTNRLSMMPFRETGHQDLQVPLNLTGSGAAYWEYYQQLTMPGIFDYFALDTRNPSSIYSCLQSAWENAHAVRGSLSSEVWESINTAWIEMKRLRKEGVNSSNADDFFDWVKERSHLFRGAMFGTLLRNDAMSFIRLGTLLERADSTARLLGVKNQLLDNDPDAVREHYRMDTLLRAVSAREAYHSIYKQQLVREMVADLLILRSESPRSLRSCIEEVVNQLELIGGHSANAPRRLAHVLHAELRFSTLEDVFDTGLQHWLTGFLNQVNAISESIQYTYLEAQ